MRRIWYRSIAAISAAALLAGFAVAARRAHYGGTLRIETAGMVQIEPNDPKLAGLVFETLVRLDEHGHPQPCLAISWTHDAAAKKWRFTPRRQVMLHNGALWEPSEASLAFPDDQPIERILAELARPRNAIAVRAADGTLVGTGPFSVVHREAGKSATLAANAAYWGGKPYLEGIEIGMGRSLRDQALDLELGKADAIEIDITSVRRLRQQNANVAVSAPEEVLAVVFDASTPAAAVEAVGLSIDRAAIQTVLLQRQGEVSGALLPQWLSGYSFVFPIARDLARARLAGAGSGMVTLGYDKADALARSIAERIAVNAGEAGIMVRVSADVPGQARVARLKIDSADAWTALEDLAEQLRTEAPAASGGLYNAERALMNAARVVPLVHVPVAWQLSPKVHGWNTNGRLEDAWLEP